MPGLRPWHYVTFQLMAQLVRIYFIENCFSLNAPVHDGSLAAVGHSHARTYAPSLTESKEKSCRGGDLCNNLRV